MNVECSHHPLNERHDPAEGGGSCYVDRMYRAREGNTRPSWEESPDPSCPVACATV